MIDLHNLREPLTPREHQVAELVADGLDDHEIAQYLGIAYGTVRAHVEKARLKVFARNRLMLAVLFLKGEIRVRDAA